MSATATNRKQDVFVFSSNTRIGVRYHTTLWRNGQVTCDCPGWIYKRAGKARSCWHTRVVRTEHFEKVEMLRAA